MINHTNYEFTDISSEEWREYVYIDGGKVARFRIDKPAWLHVSESSGHRVYNEEGFSFYLNSSFVAIKWKTKEGQPNFVA